MTEPEQDIDQLREIVDPFADELSALAPVAPLPPQPPGPTRAQVRRLRVFALLAALAYEGVMLAMMGPRADLASIPRGAALAAVALPLLAALVALVVATRTGALRIGQAGSLIGASLLAPVALFALSSLVPVGGAAPASFWASTAMCVVGSAMFSVGPLALATLAYRRAFAAAAPWRTAALGVACGALAAATIELCCSVDGASHVLVGHGAALLGGGLAGYALSRFTRT